AYDPRRDVQDPVAQGARRAACELAGEADPLCPDQQVSGGEGHLHPRRVRVEAGERHPFDASVFEVLDPVLDIAVSAIAVSRAALTRAVIENSQLRSA
ncbi:MAG: hypothetical protein M3Q30_10140, partial [Actinomycetota bacterium]|nr:hypothetical protein [Actinomycetota bacterium]